MITHKQLTLAEIFEDCQNKFDNDKYQFLSLLDEAINLDGIVPVSFNAYGYLTCPNPNNASLAIKYCGSTKEKGRTARVKWIYPKTHYHHGGVCDRDKPCNSSKKVKNHLYLCQFRNNYEYLPFFSFMGNSYPQELIK